MVTRTHNRKPWYVALPEALIRPQSQNHPHPKVHYRVHNSPSLASILDQINPVQPFAPIPNNRSKSDAPFRIWDHAGFYGDLSDSCPTLQPEDHPLSAVRHRFSQYIRTCRPYPQAISSIRDLRRCRAVTKRDSLNMEREYRPIRYYYYYYYYY
jgi:hypothetical protein